MNYVRHVAGAILLPVSIVFILIYCLGQGAGYAADLIRDGLDDLFGKPS